VINLESLVWLIVFVISVTTHEAAHAWVAYLGGDPTAYLGGQVTLNPIPHMRREPFGMVVLPVIGVLTNGFPIGWASTPFDPQWEMRYPRRAAWMALAGPAANFAIAVLALLFLRAGLELGFFFAPETLHLWEPSGFDLVHPEDQGRRRIDEGYSGWVPMWKYPSKLSKLSEGGILLPGDSFECEIDLTKLQWKRTKLSVDRSGDLFAEVPDGAYKLFFTLQSPQEVINNYPKEELFSSNELSVLLKN